MTLKEWLFDEDRGVSPVIGVILMVAITVILAAVIATFVMNMGPQQNTPANANWEWANDTSSSNWAITLEHGGGGAVTASEYDLETDAGDDWDLESALSEMTAGDSVSIGDGGSADFSNNITNFEEIQLIWEDPDSDQTQIVDTYDG